jgi:hypothetical protein
MLMETKKHHEVAERIRAVVEQLERAGHGQRFIRPWRIADLRQAKDMAECGCGISQDDPLVDRSSRAG